MTGPKHADPGPEPTTRFCFIFFLSQTTMAPRNPIPPPSPCSFSLLAPRPCSKSCPPTRNHPLSSILASISPIVASISRYNPSSVYGSPSLAFSLSPPRPDLKTHVSTLKWPLIKNVASVSLIVVSFCSLQSRSTEPNVEFHLVVYAMSLVWRNEVPIQPSRIRICAYSRRSCDSLVPCSNPVVWPFDWRFQTVAIIGNSFRKTRIIN